MNLIKKAHEAHVKAVML